MYNQTDRSKKNVDDDYWCPESVSILFSTRATQIWAYSLNLKLSSFFKVLFYPIKSVVCVIQVRRSSGYPYIWESILTTTKYHMFVYRVSLTPFCIYMVSNFTKGICKFHTCSWQLVKNRIPISFSEAVDMSLLGITYRFSQFICITKFMQTKRGWETC